MTYSLRQLLFTLQAMFFGYTQLMGFVVTWIVLLSKHISRIFIIAHTLNAKLIQITHVSFFFIYTLTRFILLVVIFINIDYILFILSHMSYYIRWDHYRLCC